MPGALIATGNSAGTKTSVSPQGSPFISPATPSLTLAASSGTIATLSSPILSEHLLCVTHPAESRACRKAPPAAYVLLPTLSSAQRRTSPHRVKPPGSPRWYPAKPAPGVRLSDLLGNPFMQKGADVSSQRQLHSPRAGKEIRQKQWLSFKKMP